MSQPHEHIRPHRPLEPGDAGYVARLDGAQRIVAALAAAPAVGVVGPTGVGKSTELAAAVDLLRKQGRSAFHAPLDRSWNMRALTVDQLYIGLTSSITSERAGVTHSTFRSDLLVALRGVKGRVVLVVDGLEKVPESHGPAILDALGELTDEADVVTVLPWYAAYGPTAMRVLADQERIVALRAIDPLSGVEFFQRLARARVGDVPPAILAEAIRWSGGLPRTFLQLLADAHVYGMTKQGVERAARDLQESVRRSILPGDTEAIRHARGTDGREIALDRRIRLLASGLLLEREGNGKLLVAPHPLLDGLLG